MDLFIHQSPGRMRVRAARLKSETSMADRLMVRLEGTPGVSFVGVRRVTGSIVIHYDRDEVLPSSLITILSRQGLLPENVVGFPRPTPSRRMTRRRQRELIVPETSFQISPETQRFLWTAGKVLVALIIERAVDKKTRKILSAFL